MGSKREEERNEKIIRGLMKLPPNRRCINCNSLGPQYVCTNFWTFICTTCSGLHREFTHRVKSVSMAKFTFQEVDALQKGGNQRARELFLKAWDPERNRLVDNSNIDKLRNFIKNVYVDKMYSMDKSSDRPPRDPQNLRSHEDETRRASSYHSYSQSPPYDFQYEERKYGKHAPSLTRKPGSDRGLYEGKLGGFFSPNRLSDYTSHERFENEGPHPRMSDYSGNGGVDLFASDILSPSSQKDIGSPFSNTSRDISREDPSLHKPDANSSKLHPRRTASVGSFGSSNSGSMSFKSVLSMSFPEVGTEPVLLAEASHEKSAAISSPPQSSVSGAYNGLDLFDTPFAPQNVSSAPPTAVNAIQQSPPSSVPSFFEQLPSQIAQPSPLDFFAAPSQQQSAPSSNGWATFDTPQNTVPIGTENSTPAAVPSSSNPFSIDQSSSYQAPASHEPSASTFAFGLESLKTVETTNFWNAFDAAAEGNPTQNVVEIHRQAAMHSASNEEKSIGNGGYESLSSHGMMTTSSESEPPSSSLSSQFNATLNDFPVASAMAGAESFATDQKPINPFDLPYDPNMESTNASQFWSMNSLQEALPNLQVPATYDDGLNAPWLPQNPASSFPPGGVSFDSTTGPLGFIAGQPPNPPIPSIHAQGPVASVGGNPFA